MRIIETLKMFIRSTNETQHKCFLPFSIQHFSECIENKFTFSSSIGDESSYDIKAVTKNKA